jgi:uncharacterized protein (DUF58 family)
MVKPECAVVKLVAAPPLCRYRRGQMTQSAQQILIAERQRELDALSRKRLGFWRRLGRSNRLFPRKLVVTREGKWIIGITLLLGAAAVNTGNNLLYLLLSLAISVIAISGILSELCLRDLELTRCYPAEVPAGEVTPLRLEVLNAKKRAALHIEAGELVDSPNVLVRPGYVLHLAPHERGQAFGAIKPLRRGPLATVGLLLTTAYPFGFARKSRLYDAPVRLLALAGVADVELPWRGAAQRGAQHSSQRAGQGDAFRGLRDARLGDAMRDIHWKVSAKRDRLVAREWEADASRVALVRFAHVAPGDDDDVATLDRACATVAGLCAALLKDGLAVGLQTWQGEVAPAVDAAGQGEALQRMRQHLAHLVLADRRPPIDWAVADDEWAKLALACQERATQIRRGEPIAWPAVTAFGRAEVFLVSFQSRPDVVTASAPDVRVLLDPAGNLLSIQRVADFKAGVA